MSVIGALLLLLSGLAGLIATWNAAKPVIDPTRRYSPAWLPAMVVSELAPFWLLLHGAVLAGGVALGGSESQVGRIGAGLLAVAILLLGWVIVRSLVGVRRLRRHVDGPVHPARGAARLIGRPVPTPPGIVESAGIEWGEGLTLDLVRPVAQPPSGPVLVYVHGGGWTGGDPQRQARDLYHAAALDGWTTLAVRYPFTPQVDVEDQIEAIRDAVRWARTRLSGLPEDGLEPTHVAIAGGSAGAHLAAMVALTTSDHGVDACVGVYGVYDMANRNQTRAHWTKTRRDVMLASVDEEPDRYRAVSPLDQVRVDAPPVLVVHGTHDTLVPIAEGTQFVDALRRAGGPVDFIPVHGAQHAFDALSSITSRTTAAAIRDWLRRTVLDPGSNPAADSGRGQAPTA